MNNKVSHIQIGMFLFLICSGIYLSVSDVILLRKSGDEVLIAMLVGTLIGLIPVLMYLKINSCLPTLNIFQKNKKLFGNIIGNILNILLLLMYMTLLSMAIRAVVIFVTSKYLQNTSYYLIGLLVIITSLIICFKGIETLARISQISFIISITLVLIIELFLIKYIEFNNILPIFAGENYIKNIFDGAIYHASTCSLLTMLLLCINKDTIKEQKKYNKTIIIFYLLASLSLTLVMFFVVSCFGYNMATLFRYPEYILLKKIGVSDSELHLENLLAFRWIFYMLALANISLYGIKQGVKSFIKNLKFKNIAFIILALLCVIGGKTAGDIPHSINVVKNYFVPFIALPMFLVLTIIFIRTCFIKKK